MFEAKKGERPIPMEMISPTTLIRLPAELEYQLCNEDFRGDILCAIIDGLAYGPLTFDQLLDFCKEIGQMEIDDKFIARHIYLLLRLGVITACSPTKQLRMLRA